MATLKNDWKMPEPPADVVCPSCGCRCDIPEAMLDVDEWYLFWECPDGCGEMPETMDLWVGIWPFVEDWASVEDMKAAGFRIN